MSFIRKIMNHFSKQCETRENHSDELLKTRYYRANLSAIFKTIEEILANDRQVNIVSTSFDHGEVAVEVNRGKKMFLIITAITVKPYETAVDVNASTEQSSITGVQPILKSEIVRLYKELDLKHSYIGAGKHATK